MRIAYLNPQSIPGTLPSTLQVLQFAEALAEVGHDVHVVTPRPAGDAPAAAALLARPLAPGLHLQHLADRQRRWYFPFRSNRLFHADAIRWLRGRQVDALYVRNLKLARALLDTHPSIPIFFETHELFAQSFRESHPDSFAARRKLRQLTRREGDVYRRCAGIVAITKALLDDLRQGYAIDTPALVAADGVDIALADVALADQVAENTRPVILYLGSLHRWKGVETLIAAMPAVTDAVLHVVGGEPGRIAELRMLAESTGAAGRIFFPGPVAPALRFQTIAASDICVLPLSETSIASRYTSPLKLFEYMAMGKAIVAADLPSIREVLSHGHNALLTDVGRPDALAAAIGTLLNDSELRMRIGAQARVDAYAYAWTNRARQVSDWMAKQMGHAR